MSNWRFGIVVFVLIGSNRKTKNRNRGNQKGNPTLKTKVGNK